MSSRGKRTIQACLARCAEGLRLCPVRDRRESVATRL